MKANEMSFEQAKHNGQMREPGATTQTQLVRASCNILRGISILPRNKNCMNFRKAIFSGFAQSVLNSVEGHSTTSTL